MWNKRCWLSEMRMGFRSECLGVMFHVEQRMLVAGNADGFLRKVVV
jgi:hypothetical protein